MSLPVVYMDILFLATLLTVVLIVGALAGWQLSRPDDYQTVLSPLEYYIANIVTSCQVR